MYFTHLIDEYCKTPQAEENLRHDYWYRLHERNNDMINGKWSTHEISFEKDLP